MMNVMKKRLSILTCVVLAFTTVSCEEYLDKNIVTTQNEEFTFKAYSNAVMTAYSVYGDLPNGLEAVWGSEGSAMLAAACDECEYAIQTHPVQRFNLGSWTPASMPDNPFTRYYAAVRKVYNFWDNSDKIDYSDVKDNPSAPGEYERRLEDIRQLKYEALLLKAYFMLDLIKRFGGVPIVSDRFDPESVDAAEIQRASLEDCVNEIISICDECAEILPVKQADEESGRVTSGTAKAIKAETLLYVASELWNNTSWADGYAHPELISMPAGDRMARWKAAADAAKEVIDMAPQAGYVLDTYANLFGNAGYSSPEVILCRRMDPSNAFEKANLPISYDKVTGGNCPTQNIVDMFQMADGRDFDWNDQQMASYPYSGRDPRLETFVVVNNSYFKSRNVECWTGGRDGAGVRNCTPTGYYLKKYVYPYSDLTLEQTSRHTWILIRLAEVYLNYIEALNEYSPGHPDIKVYYDMIRTRAGMPGLEAGLTQDKVRQLIRNERAVELCFEGKRMFDLRRWMEGDVLGQPVRAVEVGKLSDDSFTYRPYVLEERSFKPQMYFYPIPQSEINKMSHWAQNPLW